MNTQKKRFWLLLLLLLFGRFMLVFILSMNTSMQKHSRTHLTIVFSTNFCVFFLPFRPIIWLFCVTKPKTSYEMSFIFTEKMPISSFVFVCDFLFQPHSQDNDLQLFKKRSAYWPLSKFKSHAVNNVKKTCAPPFGRWVWIQCESTEMPLLSLYLSHLI